MSFVDFDGIKGFLLFSLKIITENYHKDIFLNSIDNYGKFIPLFPRKSIYLQSSF